MFRRTRLVCGVSARCISINPRIHPQKDLNPAILDSQVFYYMIGCKRTCLGKGINLKLSTTSLLSAIALLATLFVGYGSVAPLIGSSRQTGSAEKKYEVTIKDFKFDPANLTVPAGSTVTWTNRDTEAHTVDNSKDLFHSKPLANGDKFSYTFKDAGSYPYFCKLHPQMKAQITVK